MESLISVLLCSPIRQQPEILAQFLHGLHQLESVGLRLGFHFIDDNDTVAASALLARFATEKWTEIIRLEEQRPDYRRDGQTHHWTEGLTWRVAALKDRMLRHALNSGYDYAFLVDSDLVLHPKTLTHLIHLGKEIVSEVFWTQRQIDAPFYPQVWLRDEEVRYAAARGEALEEDEKKGRIRDFMSSMRDGGCYEVGGVGGCTLISRRALEKGCRFAEITNLSFRGEDRAFSIRAVALGFTLWADTLYPPLHLYRPDILARVPSFWRRIAANYLERPRITLSMTVRNESGRYLRRALLKHRPLIDDAVIVDDASTDETVAEIRECLDGMPYQLYRLKRSLFHDEVSLRKYQWQQTLAAEPDWILNLDGDEIFEDAAIRGLRTQINQPGAHSLCFRLFDFWSESHYREDPHCAWARHNEYRPFMLRYTAEFRYRWLERALHCGRFPNNFWELRMIGSAYRVKHYGWATEEDRREKYQRYMELDPHFVNSGISDRLQIENIFSPANLVEWIE